MAEDSDIKALARQLDSLSDAVSMVDKNAITRIEHVKEDVAALRKQVGDPMKTAEKEIADLKARVKDLETKMAKMGKK